MKLEQPPKYAQKFLQWLLKSELAEEVLGDLEEKFYQKLEKTSPFRAKVNYWYQTLNYLRPFAVKNNIITDLNPFFMWRHHLKLAFRNSIRDKNSFLINLIGLSTGLACFVLIALWVTDELQIDGFHEKEDHLYQVLTHHEDGNAINTWESTQGLLAEAMQAEIPEVDIAVQASEEIPQPFILSISNQKHKAYGQLVEPSFFNIFSYEILEGDKHTLLKDKKSIVISDKLANKLFDSQEVIGESIDWEIIHFKGTATIEGIFKAPGHQSSRRFDFLLPYEIYKDMRGEGIHWGNFNANTFVLLKENTDVVALNQRLPAFIQQKADWDKISMELVPFADRYLYNHFENGKQAGGRVEYVRLFSVIALFILLIACINFMNLSTAKATRKLKEVGVRKTIGADRNTLIGQYLGESIFIAFIALVVGLILVQLCLPLFNRLTDKALIFPLDIPVLAILLGITLLTGIIAGSYPALYLSSFQPVKVLKGGLKGLTSDLWIRKTLVVFQFALSVLLIVAVMIVYQQIQFIQTKNLGYDRDNLITFPKDGTAESNLETFLHQLKSIPGVVNASSTQHQIVAGGSSTTGVDWEGKDPNAVVKFGHIGVYYDFIETLGVTLKAGRSFSKKFGSEDGHLIVNEAAIKVMGLENPINRTIKLWGEEVKIIGVVKDFHFESLHEAITPMFFKLDPTFLTNIMVRIEAGKERETLGKIQSFYKKSNPGYAFNYAFLDTEFAAQYAAETRVAALSKYFAGLAILISCLGLFGLVTFSAQRRQKEIGIRKVLGASVFGIVRLLSIDFTKMVVVAIFIALPISYIIAQNWLERFAFSIDLQPWYFIIAGLGALLIAWLTVGVQTVKAALANPIEAIKSE